MKLIKCLTNAPVAIALALTGGRSDRCGAFHDGYWRACWHCYTCGRGHSLLRRLHVHLQHLGVTR